MDNKILVVDDEIDMLETCRKILERKGYNVLTTSNADKALEMVMASEPDLVIVDLKMPSRDGLEIMREARRCKPDISVIIMTAYASTETAIEAVRQGAFDYIPKPFSMGKLEVMVQRCFQYRNLLEENKHLKKQLIQVYGFENVIGKSAQILKALDVVSRVAPMEANVLILGESGTGKELIAHCIHANSARKEQRLVALDCASLPETLLESELFGHQKGAFTGALAEKRGLLEQASGGTLFLDEIGNLSLTMQMKLLRALQEMQFRRVGGQDMIHVDLRIISATNRNLEASLKEGGFREDLYYRLNVVSILLPSLRERKEDIPLLANHYFDHFRSRSGKKLDGISSAAMMLLEQYPWPGNVRELKNVMERAISLTESNQITIMDLPEQVLEHARQEGQIEGEGFVEAKRRIIDVFEMDFLRSKLIAAGGNVSRAAKLAGLKRTAFHRLMRKFNLHSDDFKP